MLYQELFILLSNLQLIFIRKKSFRYNNWSSIRLDRRYKNSLCQDLRQVLLLRGRLRFQPVDLIDATAKTSDDRVEQERVDPRPAAVAASRGPEEVGDGREDEAQEESEKEREEA